MKTPEELLMDIITQSNGTYSIQCDFCGTTWFTEDDCDYVALCEKQKVDPTKYRLSSDDGLAFGWIDGKQVVWGCCRDKLAKYAEWIWAHRGIISSYLKQRSKQELEEAKREYDELLKRMV